MKERLHMDLNDADIAWLDMLRVLEKAGARQFQIDLMHKVLTTGAPLRIVPPGPGARRREFRRYYDNWKRAVYGG